MNTRERRFWMWAAVGLLAIAFRPGAARADEKELGWSFSANLAAVWTGGNAESGTFGLSVAAERAWERSHLKLETGGTQTQSTLTTRTAVGTTDAFDVVEDSRTEKTAELYYARGRLDRDLAANFHAMTGVDWLRNTFAGIDSRTLLGIGAGNTWADSDSFRFVTDYVFTYTFQQDVVENPFTNNKFPGVRLVADLKWKLTASTEFLSTLIGDWNLDNTDDVRVDFTNALPVSISKTLQFKPSLQLLWRNDPALTEVPLLAPDETPTGDTVLVPLDELDTFFTLALVVKL